MACVAEKAAAASESTHFGEGGTETSFTAKGKKKCLSICKYKMYIVRQNCASQTCSLYFSNFLITQVG